MTSINKKIKEEAIIPLGFCGYNNGQSILCKTVEQPNKIVIVHSSKDDFIHFSRQKHDVIFKNKFLSKKLKPEYIDDIILSKVCDGSIVTFTYSENGVRTLYRAVSNKLENEWIVQGSLDVNERGGIVSDYVCGGDYYLYYGESSIFYSQSKDLKNWKNENEPVLKPRPGFFDNDKIKFIDSKVTASGILVFYDASIKTKKGIKIQIGVALFSLSNPNKLIWRTTEPIYEEDTLYKKDFVCKGILFKEDKLSIYWYSKSTGIVNVLLAVPFSSSYILEGIKKLEKCDNNPIISPEEDKSWMNEGVFNPAAIVIKDKTHLLFRAVGSDGISRVGHTSSVDGINFEKVNPKPVFHLSKTHFGASEKRFDPVIYPSGGSWGGCEDPRLVKVNDTVYMTFNAFDGWDFIRVGYTSIKEKDFEKGIWNWTKPALISPQGQINKNWVIFPEKINGQFAILHSLTPEVQVDYVERLEDLSSGRKLIKSKFERPAPRTKWDTWVRGAGPSPVKTDDGWLVFYHAISADEPTKYKLGVLLLDLKDPRKVLARASSPILLPEKWYENESKPGIVYACGAVIKDDTLFIYYGGGDKFVCVATVPFKDFMESLRNITERVPIISKIVFS